MGFFSKHIKQTILIDSILNLPKTILLVSVKMLSRYVFGFNGRKWKGMVSFKLQYKIDH